VSRPAPATSPPGPATGAPRSARLAGGLFLGVAALILGLMAALAWSAHVRASAWPIVRGAVLARTVERQRVNGKGPSFVVRDTYRVPGANGPATCHWDDPLGTGIRRWIDARLETRDRYWPVGSEVPVHAEPAGDRCEPVDGFERAVRPTFTVVAMAALACLCGLVFLWRRPAQVS